MNSAKHFLCKKKDFIRILVLLLYLTLMAKTALAVVYVDENISTDTTWTKANSPYIISPGVGGSSRVTVLSGATLTIEPGVEVQFNSRQGFMKVQGKLLAQGTAFNTITFTRTDDLIAADQSWNGIIFDGLEASASLLQYAILDHGGSRSTSGNGEGMITCWDGASPTISDSTILASDGMGYSYGEGIYIEHGSPTLRNTTIKNCIGYGVHVVDSSPVMTGNSFSDNGNGAILLETDTSKSFPLFEGNSFSGPNEFIYVKGNILQSGTWEYAGTPYIINPGYAGAHRVTIQNGATLTIEPGVEVLFDSRQGFLKVQGKLLAQGTSENNITFTATSDLLASGDTWNGIIFDGIGASASLVEYALIQYGGSRSTSGNGEGMITCWNGASPTISRSSIIHSGGPASNAGIGVYTSEGSQPVLEGNIIANNKLYGVFNDDMTVCVDARYNYWGDPTGPLDESNQADCVKEQGLLSYNPNGKGDRVSDYVLYEPWNLSAAPCTCPDSDNDGVPNAWDHCPGTPAGAATDKKGCKDSGELLVVPIRPNC